MLLYHKHRYFLVLTTFGLTIGGAFAAPLAVDDTATAIQDATILIPVLTNDVPIDAGSSLNSMTINIKRPFRRGIQALRSGQVRYTPTTGFIGTETFNYTVRNSSGNISNSALVTVTVKPPNASPIISLPGTTVVYDTTTATPVILDAGATASDTDSADFSGGVLTADITGGCDDSDRLSVFNEGVGAGQISLSGATVSYSGLAIGTMTTESDCTTPTPSLSIALNAGATPAATQALLRNITFDSPQSLVEATRTAQFLLTDGDGGASNTDTATVQSISEPPDPPV